MTKTTNYQLNQWAKSDRIRMDDFNADNQKIDAALAAASVIAGTYQGTGSNAMANVTVTLGFRPKAVLIFTQTAGTGFKAGLCVAGASADDITITDTGFTAKGGFAQTDSSGTYRNPYRYLAWR